MVSVGENKGILAWITGQFTFNSQQWASNPAYEEKSFHAATGFKTLLWSGSKCLENVPSKTEDKEGQKDSSLSIQLKF